MERNGVEENTGHHIKFRRKGSIDIRNIFLGAQEGLAGDDYNPFVFGSCGIDGKEGVEFGRGLTSDDGEIAVL